MYISALMSYGPKKERLEVGVKKGTKKKLKLMAKQLKTTMTALVVEVVENKAAGK